MKNGKTREQSAVGKHNGVVDVSEGARRATGEEATTPGAISPLEPGQRWTAARKKEVVLRLLRGESIDAISRELGITMEKLEKWLERSLNGIDASLKERTDDPVVAERDLALKRIGELTMENELLRTRCGVSRPFNFRRSRR